MAHNWTWGYTGGIQTVNCPPGRYLVECFGAGGGTERYQGGYGGYASGIITVKNRCQMQIGIGGAGTVGAYAPGGFNGGGRSGIIQSSGSGGGATFVAIGPNRGILRNYENCHNELICVAGGGGGSGYGGWGGSGGGNILTNETGYAFGQGECCGEPSDNGNLKARFHFGEGKLTTVLESFIAPADGTLHFYSTWTDSDPMGYVYKNGALAGNNDDNGAAGDRNFSVYVSVRKGDSLSFYVRGFSIREGNCDCVCDYPTAKVPRRNGGGAGGGFYGGHAAVSDYGGGGGSGWVNSICQSPQSIMGKGARPGAHGWVKITQLISIYDPIAILQSRTFNYLGYPEGIRLEPGLYKFECWGASGGSGKGANAHTTANAGGLGGYTSCVMRITSETIVYAFAGGAGHYGSGDNPYGGPIGGYNGGGNGGISISGSGGGATDFRLSITSQYLDDISAMDNNSLMSRFCVAGGGGGSDDNDDVGVFNGNNDGSGGSGGGITAQGYWINGEYNAQGGATQFEGNAFGQGAHSGYSDAGGAGGGWYGGRSSNHGNGGAGGGSSYIKGYPGCNIWYLYHQGAAIHYLRDGIMNQFSNNGNGYARITRLTGKINITYKNCTGNVSSIDYGQVATATISLAEDEYFLSWGITDGYSFESTNPLQARFKAPAVSDDTTISIIGNKAKYATLVPINCEASLSYVKPGNKITITATQERNVENYLSEFVSFLVDESIFTKTQISEHEIDIMTDQSLSGNCYVEALYAKKKTNSVIHKPSQNTEANYEFLNEQE